MRLAICFSGEPRMFESAYPNIKKYILDKFDCDIYIHTFLKSKNIKYGILNSIRYPNQNTIEEYVNLYNPKAVDIEYYDEKLDNFFDEKTNQFPKTEDGRTKRFISMSYGINKVNTLCKYKDIKYDYILRIRPDVSLTGFDIPKKLNLAIDNHGNGAHKNAPGDILACGKPKEMNIYASLYHNFEIYYYSNDIVPHPEITLEYHLKYNNISYEISNYSDTIYRPSAWNSHNPSESKF